MMLTKSYRELVTYETFEERYEYLKINGLVGSETFGYNRFFNQHFYHSPEWRRTRNKIILRDNGCDLGIPGYEIFGSIYVHHINPVTFEDVESFSDSLFDPENLICVSFNTHNAIHYGDSDGLLKSPIERLPGDTCPWRKNE